MSPQVDGIITFLAAITVLSQIAIVMWFVAYALTRARSNMLLRVTARHAYLMAFIVSLGATVGSLVLSVYAQFVPCTLCWWQRIFMFPIPIILAIALWKRRHDVEDYVLGLSIFGVAVALYHTYLQYGGAAFTSCGLAGDGTSCAARLVFEFGYITIPLMTLTAFAFIIMAMVSRKIAVRQKLL